MPWRSLYLAALGSILLACQQDPAASVPPGSDTAAQVEVKPPPTASDTLALTHDLHPQPLDVGGSLRYSIPLKRGDTLFVATRQLGVDIRSSLLAPGGALLLEIDHPSGPLGIEDLAWTAAKDGAYTLVIACPGPTGAEKDRSATDETGSVEVDWIIAQGEGPARQLAESIASYLEAEALRVKGEGLLSHYRTILALLEPTDPLHPVATRDHAPTGSSLDRALRWLRARALRRLGQLQYQHGDLRAAALSFERALPLLRPDGSGWEVAALLNDAGITHRLVGEPNLARRRFEEALDLSETIGHFGAATSALNNLGVLHEALGEPEQALAYYGRALDGWEALELAREAATTHHNMGITFITLGLLTEAHDALHQALDLYHHLDDPAAQATTLTAIGWTQALAEDHRAALDFYDRALALHRLQDDPRGEVATLDRRALALFELGQPLEALRDLEAALDLLQGRGNKVSEAHVQTNLGTLYVELGEHGRAGVALTRARKLFRDIGDHQGEALVLASLGHLARTQKDFATALSLGEEALAMVESVRQRLSSPSFRQSFLATRYDLVDELIGLRMALAELEPGAGHDRLAFELAERARARGLLEGLTGGPGWWQRADPELVEHERWLRGEIHFQEERRLELLKAGDPGNKAPILTHEVDGLLIEYQRLEGELRESAGDTAPAQAVGLAEIQLHLDEETALLVVHPGRSRSVAWWVTHDTFRSFELAPPTGLDLEALARRTRDHLAASHLFGHRGQTETDSQLLSGVLLGPLADTLANAAARQSEKGGTHRLVVVADGALALVPFTVLPSPLASSTTPAPSPIPRLVEHFEITQLPSISVLPLLRRPAPTPPRLLAMVADPVFTSDDPRLDPAPQIAALEPSTGVHWARPGVMPPILAHGSRGDLGQLRRLPWSGHEAAAILGRIPETAERLTALGLAAHRDLVTGGELASYRLIHFATHGWLDDRHPLLSGIVLSRFDPRGRRRPAFLRVPEIARLHLPADLVVLSACETGRGQTLRGEGVVGMAHAFFQAGARRLVVSHWAVDDEATAQLMDHFYQALLEQRLSPAAALRQAQLALLHDETWSAPYYWGAFTLQGDWRAIEGLPVAQPAGSSR